MDEVFYPCTFPTYVHKAGSSAPNYRVTNTHTPAYHTHHTFLHTHECRRVLPACLLESPTRVLASPNTGGSLPHSDNASSTGLRPCHTFHIFFTHHSIHLKQIHGPPMLSGHGQYTIPFACSQYLRGSLGFRAVFASCTAILLHRFFLFACSCTAVQQLDSHLYFVPRFRFCVIGGFCLAKRGVGLSGPMAYQFLHRHQ